MPASSTNGPGPILQTAALDFQQRLVNMGSSLNETDQVVARYLMEHRDEVVDRTVRSIAADLFVAPNAVIRLCKKLGYDGFSDVRAEFKRLSAGDVAPSRVSNLERTLALLDPARELAAARIIARSSRLILYGYADSGTACKLMKNHFAAVEPKVVFHTYHYEVYRELDQYGDSCLLCVSLSGATEQTLELAQYAHAADHAVISLTHLCDNPLAHMAAVPLYCWSPRTQFNGNDVSDWVPPLFVLQSLYERYRGLMGL